MIIGLVIVLDKPGDDDEYYSCTGLFIEDGFLGKGYGNQAVEASVHEFRAEGLRNRQIG